MTKDLVLDAQLSKDSYNYSNVDAGGVAGWSRVTVSRYELPSNSNFAAQLYQGPDGSYKIAYRGTVDLLKPGDAEINKAIVTGAWSAEMTESVKFTYYAIEQIQVLESGISFEAAKLKLSITGHSQGGFEAELNAQLFGLNGTSLDGPGASRVIGSQGWQQAKDWVKAQEPKAQLDTGVGDFVARRYTALVGGTNAHIAGVHEDNAAASLALQSSHEVSVDVSRPTVRQSASRSLTSTFWRK